MKTPSLTEIKKELNHLDALQLKEHLLRLIRYKKENKELLSYLLFEADDEQAYIEGIKEEMEAQFQEINKRNFYFVKKSLRKILRYTNKHIKYSGSKQTEVELLIYYCQMVKKSGIRLESSVTLINLYKAQLKKINLALKKLHEDFQFDYEPIVNEL